VEALSKTVAVNVHLNPRKEHQDANGSIQVLVEESNMRTTDDANKAERDQLTHGFQRRVLRGGDSRRTEDCVAFVESDY
jgi:hypothetical protein